MNPFDHGVSCVTQYWNCISAFVNFSEKSKCSIFLFIIFIHSFGRVHVECICISHRNEHGMICSLALYIVFRRTIYRERSR